MQCPVNILIQNRLEIQCSFNCNIHIPIEILKRVPAFYPEIICENNPVVQDFLQITVEIIKCKYAERYIIFRTEFSLY